ncbi:hypothetical protein QFC21_002194 [Naganishia friedmannii]|uniref:Uncharacterized protein n=1 Tax=Naganishia friedmannii TaxID=89922 RepID=A0ACC2VWB0_9TREE|nr:hypothetical protein QFC21_002194 [Naganishia friedmannii]
MSTGNDMASAPPPTAISAGVGLREQGNADLMFSWKGVQGLLEENAELDNVDEEEDSEGQVQVVDFPPRGHEGDISFTGSELYPNDGYARGSSPTGGPSYGSTGPTTPASSRSGNHRPPVSGLRSVTSAGTALENRRRNRQVSRQSLLAVFNSPVSDRHGVNAGASTLGTRSATDSRSPTQLRFDDVPTSQRNGLKYHRADTDVTVRPARPTGSPSSHPTTRRNSSSSDSDSGSGSDQASEGYRRGEEEERSDSEDHVLSSSPTQLDIPPAPTAHQTPLPTQNPRGRNRGLTKPHTLRLPSRLSATKDAKYSLPGRRIQSQTTPSTANGERTPLLPRARQSGRVGSVQVPPRLVRAQTDEGVVNSAEGNGAGQMAVKRIGLLRRWLSHITNPSPGTIRILKCSIAYLLASLFTFVPQLSALLSTTHETDVHGRVMPRPAYSAHMVATVMVYFHPGRSMGSMFLASKYCIILALLAALFSLASIFTLQLFDHFFPEEGTFGFQAGDVTVLVLWIGSSMAGLAWLKQWVNNPSFNTGCSMAAVTLFTVVVKEGGFAKLGEVLLIVVVGATTKLQTSISTTLDSFSTLFRLLNATFLLDRPPNDASYASLQTAAQLHSAAFTQLKADLAEAQHERLLDRRIDAKQRERYAAVTDSLTRLAQHLTGMRGGTGLQSDLLKGTKRGILEINTASSSDSDDKEVSDDPKTRHASERQDGPTQRKRKLRGDHDLSKAGNLFWAFRDEVAEEMRQLTDLSCKVLHDVKLAMTDLNSSADHSTLLHDDHDHLRAALKNFTITTLHAINRLYHGTLRKPDSAIFGLPHVSNNGGSSEAVYLIYFFIFTLEEFVREEIQLVEAMCELVAGSHRASPPGFIRWFSPMRWQSQIKSNGKGSRLLQLNPLDPSDLQPPVFPKRDKNNPNTLTTPSRATLTKRERIYQALWALQARLRENDIKYALKRQSDLSAFEIGWRRATSVIVGVVWATVVSNYWWPFAARQELRIGLSDQNHDEACTGHPLVDRISSGDEEASKREMENDTTIRQFLSMELHLQIQLIKLRALLIQTANEPRLKGPFPKDTYGGIINSCQTMLDRFHSMRCVTTRQEWDNTIHRDFIRPVNTERKEMVSNVILYFYLLAASLRLRFPMPASLPPAETARIRLVNAMSRLDIRVTEPRHRKTDSIDGKEDATPPDTRHLLYFAYAMAMQGVIKELEYVGGTLQDVFGIINQSTRAEFDALFV